MEDFHFREIMTHFDHERMPERIVHPRGSAAHGYFQVYKPLTQHSKAALFADPAVKTPVFVRFSNVNGSRGTADTIRDARGFATKFYTSLGDEHSLDEPKEVSGEGHRSDHHAASVDVHDPRLAQGGGAAMAAAS